MSNRIYPNIDGEKDCTNGVCLTCKVRLNKQLPGKKFNVEYSYMNGEDEEEIYCLTHALVFKRELQDLHKRVSARREKDREEYLRQNPPPPPPKGRRYESRQDNRNYQTEFFIKMEQKGFKVMVVNGDEQSGDMYQVRINDVLDIFPTNQKWHDLKENKRGSYSDIENFCMGFFRTKP